MAGWPPSPAIVRELLDMGFDAESAAQAVRQTGGSGVQHAIAWLVDGSSASAGPGAGPGPVSPTPAPARQAEMGPLARGTPALTARLDSFTLHDRVGFMAEDAKRGPTPGVGVAAILQREQARAAATDSSLGAAFQDLTQLMAKAEEMVQLAGYFSERLRQPGTGDETLDSDTALELFQMGIVDPVTKESAGRGYHRQLARQLVDVLAKPLELSGGMLPLPDVYCVYNRARGTELISPDDLLEALRCLRHVDDAPIELRDFASGLRVVQLRTLSDDRLSQRLLDMLDGGAVGEEGLGPGLGAADAAAVLGIPLPVAAEQLALAELKGLLCRDEAGADGVVFYRNFFTRI